MSADLDMLRRETAMKIAALNECSRVSLSAIERILRDHDAVIQAQKLAPYCSGIGESVDEFEPWVNCGRTRAVNRKGNYEIPSSVPYWSGCYRLMLDDDSEYIGEGFNLHRRVREYCDRASSVPDLGMRDRIKFAGGMTIFVSVQSNTKQLFSSYKEHESAFPGATDARRRFEARLEREAKERGALMLDSSGKRRTQFPS